MCFFYRRSVQVAPEGYHVILAVRGRDDNAGELLLELVLRYLLVGLLVDIDEVKHDWLVPDLLSPDHELADLVELRDQRISGGGGGGGK